MSNNTTVNGLESANVTHKSNFCWKNIQFLHL